MRKQLEALTRAVTQWQSQTSTLGHVHSASELEKIIDVSLSESIGDAEKIEQAISDYIKYSPNSAHPEFLKLLYSGVNKQALLGDWVSSLSNSTMHTFQVGPVATLMELELINQWCKLVGFNRGDGVMVSGGSQANLMGMMLARHRAAPQFKAMGYQAMRGKALVAYTSDQAHYSNLRAVNALGIGTNNLRSIASDSSGRINPSALASAIADDVAAGHQPFFLGLTAGTTVVGAFDQIKECSELAGKHNMWVHVDGAWGAPVLFSNKHKHLLQDSHLCDSFAWDAHKLMNVPITAAVILVKQPGLLKECIAGGGGDYLFHNDSNAQYNLGERSLQCGRRADSLKVWLSWKAIGNHGFAQKVEALMELKQHAVQMIKSRQSLELLAEADFLNVLFRFTHEQLSDDDLDALNIRICKQMVVDGGPYVDHARYKGKVGVRLIIANSKTQKKHIEKLLDHCNALGQTLLPR